ncbi:glycosyltransferase [Gramella sp. AN32]|uniref:Glycosyltransferase family 2 protein n=1 Tax=Christiangramia antarctica TaxID=2058158 RepID=A0ABW5X6V1_9FLAO|nr:glycosyltransferase [Gramella sp. AN32]MCM4154684.1 glycosyl transferase family 2 [Gramella sp. AN32]
MNKENRSLNFSLIVCTYQRAESLRRLLDSVKIQSRYPNKILIIDGSEDSQTDEMLEKENFNRLKYIRVGQEYRGLTKQRNYGIDKVDNNSEIVCFLDDDIVLENNYFEQLLNTYRVYPEAIAVGGWIKDETVWEKVKDDYSPKFDEFLIDGYVRKLGLRNVLRKRLGLLSHLPPGVMPEFSHGFSTGFLPPSGKIYEVEYFMGGISSYKKSIFSEIGFSEKFAGYGLYEDMDFCLRASRLGKLYVNTSAKVAHLHEESGRPDYFKYGRMVIENGYHVWRLKYKNPDVTAKVKWYSIHFLLLFIRFFNGIKDRRALEDAKGRFSALIGLLIKR